MFSNKTPENPLFELVRHRRSVRRCTGEKISDDVAIGIVAILAGIGLIRL